MRRLLVILALVVAGCDPLSLHRLLMVAGGGASFAGPLHPPTDASWTRSASNPILVASVAWENGWVQEPTVLIDGSNYVMFYTGGQSPSGYGIGRATCPLTSDPTNPANWTKYASNPVFGQGGSSYAGRASRNFVIKVDSTYYLYFNDANNSLSVTTSADGISWDSTPSVAIAHDAAAFATGWVNLFVWTEAVNDWHMLIEAVGGAAADRIVAATTSSDGLTWATPAAGAIASLEINGGYTGGPAMWRPADPYDLWFHASDTTGGGGLPTDIYHAEGGLASWTVAPATPVLTHLGSGTDEYDQVADPFMLVSGTTAYLFYTAANNTVNEGGPWFKIGVATAPAVP